VDWNPPVENDDVIDDVASSETIDEGGKKILGLSGKINHFNTDINEIDEDEDEIISNKKIDMNKIISIKKKSNNDNTLKDKEIKKNSEKNKNNSSSNFVENMMDIANKKDISKLKKNDKKEKKNIPIIAMNSLSNIRKYSLLLEKFNSSGHEINELYFKNIDDTVKV
jgi:hypothetical protein